MDRIRKQLAELKARLEGLLAARAAANDKHHTLIHDAETSFKSAGTQFRNELQDKLQRLISSATAARKSAKEKWKHRAARLDTAYVRTRSKLEGQAHTRTAAHEKQQQAVHAQAKQEYEQQVAVLQRTREDKLAQFSAHQTAIGELRQGVLAFAATHGVGLDADEPQAQPEAAADGGGVAAERLAERLAQIKQQLDLARQKKKRRTLPLLVYVFVALAFGAAAGLVYHYTHDWMYVYAVAGVFIIALGATLSLSLAAREKIRSTATDFRRKLSAVNALIEQHKQLAEEIFRQGLAALEDGKIQRILAADGQQVLDSQENKKTLGEALARLDRRRKALTPKITLGSQEAQSRLEYEAEKMEAELRALYKDKFAQLRSECAARKKQGEEEHRQAIANLAAEWNQVLARMEKFGAENMSQCLKNQPPWSALSAQTLRLPAQFISEVYLGKLRMDLKSFVPQSEPEGQFSIPAAATLTLPALLAYPARGSLYVRAGSQKRSEAMRLIFNTVLRLFASFPANKVKVTIIDPVGLGQNFAALMHLADHDESLVNGRIWTEPTHIESRLSELTEHMEKVIQKYLRNKYASIDLYNLEAGQMAEPYRFLVLADFPAGFSDLALERLASIISSGARCGVYTLILHDDRQPFPKSLDETQLRANSLIVTATEDYSADQPDPAAPPFKVDDAALNRGGFTGEEPPAKEQLDGLLKTIGTQCQQAVRVELSFETAVPKEKEYWSSSSILGVRLPLGRTGADRLQYLDLGKGTSQHALIAGKTGSGKSNLFHVIITNAALWYGPRELELYLIDFKKGVEFKTYGTYQLPHARVVAVESDREFGLSVLRRIDRELGHRGELFRKARVQDLQSYRKSGDGEMLPRTLLLVDEFQEFFTEDDGVAQNAALLLDRIVRQGRAFGIHVILGSQTLGGAYALAKSTLGQMGVRIALQCNEADSYLILSDDNAAARLLSRPGEAIYNDMSGLIEGNNPFQTVFLSKDNQDAHLEALRKRAAKEGFKPAEPLVVFEGNVPAELGRNPLLRELVAGNYRPLDEPDIVWLGEANAIKGPTEAVFSQQAGSNLLVIGQRGDAQLAMCCATLACLAAGNAPDGARICVLDGTPSDSGTQERLAAVAAALPHKIEIATPRRAGEIIQELAAEAKSRQEGGSKADARCYLLLLGLENFRMLRQADEFDFSSGDKDAVSPAKSFTDLLSEGSSVGIFTIVWCDTLTNLNRMLSRKTLREFTMRTLFQMSATDSSELIDSPAANRLGLYNALMFTTQEGAVEKFRPYALPDLGLIEELGRTLRAKKGAPAVKPAKK